VSPSEWVRLNSLSIAAVAAGAHLAVVILGAARVPVPGASLAGRIYGVYGAYSGANNSYGFFAPGVASKWRATLDSYHPAEEKWTTWTKPAANLELGVLDSTITGFFSNDELREAMAASWAGSGMAQAPGAAVVVVRAEAFMVPTMAEYREGARGRWQTLAAYAFTTDDRMRLVDAGSRGARSP
jgi:hypothetical protein